jgi:hypothetical protein
LGLGALFSLVKAPCLGAIYLTILNLIAVQKAELEGILYLCMYNFSVILPILIIGTAIVIGLSPTKVDRFRKEKRALIRLVTGIILVVLGSVPDVWYDLSGRQIYMPALEGLRTSNDPTTRPPYRKQSHTDGEKLVEAGVGELIGA